MYNYTSATDCDSAKVLPTSEKSGWFMNLNQYGQGEQTVSSALIAGGSAIFNTNRPTPADNDVCTNSLGEARGYFVDLLTASGGVGSNQSCGGARSGIFVGGGLPQPPVLTPVPLVCKLRTHSTCSVQKDGG